MNDHLESLAEVAIKRITFKGSNEGGAFECVKCPAGSISLGQTFSCTPCFPGTEPNNEQTACIPCREGWFNNADSGKCRKCPPFTNSKRHDEDAPIYKDADAGEKITNTAATSCELDGELHVRQTGQIYKGSHFQARNLCGKDNINNNKNICASEGIIGPISDVQHTSLNKRDAQDEDDLLDEE